MTLEEAFVACLRDGEYPGPTALNRRRGRAPRASLSGRECRERRVLMWQFGVAYARGVDGPMGWRPGSVPCDDPSWPYLYGPLGARRAELRG